MLLQKIEYIHNNPLKKGLVVQPEHGSYSSVSNYTLNSGRLDVDIIVIELEAKLLDNYVPKLELGNEENIKIADRESRIANLKKIPQIRD